eukprot:TRINITY_DN5390_c0_g1_i4.p1 TRINITY_DN5390_c0_g1~~TRINITY_DN5390_c0_g1_i4.p1  ORF type:complete len:257 (-),score=29.29 TRINITY_DN5390_c0_g1_i4:59-829(-)
MWHLLNFSCNLKLPPKNRCLRKDRRNWVENSTLFDHEEMKAVVAVFVCLCICQCWGVSPSSQNYPITLPLWPDFWSATWLFVNSTSGEIMQYGNWYYDWSVKSLRQDNQLGGCVSGSTTPCSFIFIGENCYALTGLGSAQTCCLFMNNLGATPPDYLEDSIYKGNGTYQWIDVPSSIWSHESTSETYYQTLGQIQLPVVLEGDIENKGTTAIVWQDYNFATFPKDTFTIPSNCASSCPTLSETARASLRAANRKGF